MKITKTNYEEYALDYIEGTLSRDLRRAFERFLEENPDTGRLIRAMQKDFPVLIPDSTVRFEDKALLKRRASIRSLIIGISAVAAVLLVGVWVFNHYGAMETDLLNPEQPLSLARQASPELLPEPVAESSAGMQGQTEMKETPVLVADVQTSPVRKAVKSPVETVAKTVDADPKRILLPEDTRQDAGTIQTASTPVEKNHLYEQVVEEEPVEENAVREVFAVLADEEKELLARNEEVAEPELTQSIAGPADALASAETETILFTSDEYVVEQTNEVVFVLETRDYFQDEKDKAGFLNVFGKKGFKKLATGILAPLGELSPIKVYDSNEERVIEFASIPVSRKNKQEAEKE